MFEGNPFPGLRPFQFDENYLFFGREEQVSQLLQRLGNTRFLAVVGASGSGKSSLVRAGLLPELHGGTMTSTSIAWELAIMRPGGDPTTKPCPTRCGRSGHERVQRRTPVTSATKK